MGFCRYYLNQGWQVIALSRSGIATESLADVATTHLQQINVELGDESSIRHAAERIEVACSGIDLLLNNAGIAIDQPFGHWQQQAMLDAYQINAVAPALLIQALANHMNHDSKTIQLSSGLASIDLALNSDGPFNGYSMSKVALNMLTKRLSEHFRARKIVVAALSPGWVQTDMGGAEAPTSVEQVVPIIATTIANLSIEQTGGFYDERGQAISW
ncbi:short-chain dehydrogenase [Neiella marina]|uniref:Short-chain dehydrogenase n=1 Tax=Neiella marina TaxID=508461 RepID=A0A8J2XNJ3_9GAMM|nr:short-chain dehydrogenase [Neiella marina]